MCPEPRAEYRRVDAANVDLKGITEDLRKVCVSHLRNVLDTLAYLHQTNVVGDHHLLDSDRNDSDAEVAAECRWIRENLRRRRHFTAFHPDYKMIGHPATPTATLTRAREIGIMKVPASSTPETFTMPGGSTSCPGCRATKCSRLASLIRHYALTATAAAKHAAVDGVYDGPAASQRRPPC